MTALPVLGYLGAPLDELRALDDGEVASYIRELVAERDWCSPGSRSTTCTRSGASRRMRARPFAAKLARTLSTGSGAPTPSRGPSLA